MAIQEPIAVLAYVGGLYLAGMKLPSGITSDFRIALLASDHLYLESFSSILLLLALLIEFLDKLLFHTFQKLSHSHLLLLSPGTAPEVFETTTHCCDRLLSLSEPS